MSASSRVVILGASAITHRRFDVARLQRALPDLRLTPMREGLRAVADA